MKKILILANKDITLLYFRKELIERLINEENKVIVSFPKSEKVKIFEDLGCEFVDTDVDRRGTNPIKDLQLIIKYNKILKEIKPDVVLTYTIKPNIYGGIACRKNKIPYIANITGLGTAMENKGLLQKILVFLYKIALKKVNCCFVQNEENKNYLIENKMVKEEQCKLIPGSGVNLDKFCKEDYPNDEIIKFLFIGRIMKDKGIEEYLEAAKKIKAKYQNTEFHIIGSFEEEKYKEKLEESQKENIVIYHGQVSDTKLYMKDSHCTILPSYHEGKSNVLLETAATGRPIITTNIVGCQEIVEDSKTGFIAKVKDTEDLIDKVEKFIQLTTEQRKKMGELGRKKVEKEYDRNIVINAYMHEIDKLNFKEENKK